MAEISIYAPTYSNSWAIVIGVNEYESASPLGYARNDAEQFANLLKDKFSFDEKNITLLVDEDATRKNILSNFLAFASGRSEPNDRLIFFFAGHGYTQSGKRGEIGFLVPVDGRTDDLTSLVRWDELTSYSELIPAKHVLYIMDACYGGLAVTRRLPPGARRFAKDMLQRYSRQVLTAGKANETVADAGGPRPGHSVFTGHLLDALSGEAASTDGIITANGVMAYVYERVAKDYQSQQTPHYGFLDGDGDLIFELGAIEEFSTDSEADKDILLEPAPASEPQDQSPQTETLSEHMKILLSDSKYRITLNDFVLAEVRRVLPLIGDSKFPLQGVAVEPSAEEFLSRIKRYESLLEHLVTIVILLARWGNVEQRNVLEQVFARFPDAYKGQGGYQAWLGLRWYPVTLLMYTAGIAALADQNYNNLALILLTKITSEHSGNKADPIIIPAVQGMLEVQRSDLLKTLPGHEQYYAPKSEYLFKTAQPMLEDQLFLGRSYEGLFDRFEIFLALISADRMYDERQSVWGPPGRFAWKFGRGKDDPYSQIVAEAARERANWAPLQAGFFDGSYDRFATIAEGFTKLLSGLRWF